MATMDELFADSDDQFSNNQQAATATCKKTTAKKRVAEHPESTAKKRVAEQPEGSKKKANRGKRSKKKANPEDPGSGNQIK